MTGFGASSKSNKTMRVKVLYIGINEYSEMVGKLNGCINDMKRMEALLGRLYRDADMEARHLYDKAATYEAIAADGSG